MTGLANKVLENSREYRNNFLDSKKSIARLMKEYYEHKNLIVALDFDNTIWDYHSAGLDMNMTMEVTRAAQVAGLEVFIFTANEDHELVREQCKKLFGQPLQINTNSLNHLFDSRKPFYSILLDDRAGLESAVWQLANVVDLINRLQSS